MAPQTPLFPVPGTPPKDTELALRIGRPFGIIEASLRSFTSGRTPIAHSWKFSKTSGWYVTYDKGKQRLFYLFPKRADFLLKIVFNDKGVQHLTTAVLPPDVRAKLHGAKKYAEGTLLEFTAREINAHVLAELLRIKVGSVA